MGGCASKSSVLKNVDDDDTVVAPPSPLEMEEMPIWVEETEEEKGPMDVNVELELEQMRREDRAEVGLEEAREPIVEANKETVDGGLKTETIDENAIEKPVETVEPQSSEAEASEGIQAKVQQSNDDETKDKAIKIVENETLVSEASTSEVNAIEDANKIEKEVETTEAETSNKIEKEVEASDENNTLETTEAETSEKIVKEVEATHDGNAVETIEAETSEKIVKEVEATHDGNAVETTEAETFEDTEKEVIASEEKKPEAEIVEEKKVEEEKPAVARSRFRLWF